MHLDEHHRKSAIFFALIFASGLRIQNKIFFFEFTNFVTIECFTLVQNSLASWVVERFRTQFVWYRNITTMLKEREREIIRNNWTKLFSLKPAILFLPWGQRAREIHFSLVPLLSHYSISYSKKRFPFSFCVKIERFEFWYRGLKLPWKFPCRWLVILTFHFLCQDGRTLPLLFNPKQHNWRREKTNLWTQKTITTRTLAQTMALKQLCTQTQESQHCKIQNKDNQINRSTAPSTRKEKAWTERQSWNVLSTETRQH